MPNLFKLSFAVLFFIGAATAQTRVDVFPEAVEVQTVKLTPLTDGGCVAEWCGAVTSLDGGVQLYDCAARELKAPINANRCAALVQLGEAPLAKQMRLTLDGGAQ